MTVRADLGGFIFIAVIALIGWLYQKVQAFLEKSQGAAPKAPAPGARRGGESDEERTRKFLEALGLPVDRPVRTREETLRPPELPKPARGGQLPVPPIVAQPARRVRQPEPVVPRKSAEESAQVFQAMPTVTSRVHLPDLQTPTIAEFRTEASTVSAIPREQYRTVSRTPATTPRAEEMRRLVRSPQALRQAILLREILGPPRSLQST